MSRNPTSRCAPFRRDLVLHAPLARWLAIIAVLSLPMVSCFTTTPPVRERLEIDLSDLPQMALRLRVDLAASKEFEYRGAMQQRLAELRRDIEDGRDPWSRRFERLECLEERFSWERREGEVLRYEREAVLSSTDSLPELLAGEGVQLFIEHEEGSGLVEIFGGSYSHLSRRQRDKAEGLVELWAVRVETYLEAVREFYEYLDSRPGRADECLEALYRELLDLGEDEQIVLDEREQLLVSAVFEQMVEQLEILQSDKDSRYTLDELSRLLYDPFPAAIALRLPSKAVEVEGFLETGNNGYEIPVYSIFHALLRLDESWISPNPLGVYWRHQQALRAGSAPAGEGVLASIVSGPRRAEAAEAREIQEALAGELRPATIYRVRW